jgi:hypothetical protein
VDRRKWAFKRVSSSHLLLLWRLLLHHLLLRHLLRGGVLLLLLLLVGGLVLCLRHGSLELPLGLCPRPFDHLLTHDLLEFLLHLRTTDQWHKTE